MFARGARSIALSVAALALAIPAHAQWQPTKPVDLMRLLNKINGCLLASRAA